MYFSYYDLLFIVLGASFGIIIRMLYPLFNQSNLSDNIGVYSKLINARYLKKYSYKLIDAFNGKSFPRPLLFHFLISKLPKKYWRIILITVNSSFDVIISIIIYFLTKYLFIAYNYYSNIEITSLFSMLIFLTSPILLTPRSARLKSTNNRTFGFFLTFLYLFSLYPLLVNNIYWFIFISLLIGYIILLSSTFAWQVMLFFSISLSLLYFNIIPILIQILLFSIGYFIPSLRIRELLIFKINHFHISIETYKGTISEKRKLFKHIIMFFFKFKKRPKEKLMNLIIHSPLIVIIYLVPTLIIFLLVFDVNQFVNPFHFFSLNIVLSSIFSFIFTSIWYFKLFGESERYFEYSSPFISLLFVVSIYYNFNSYIEIFIGVFLFQIIIVVILLLFNKGMIQKMTEFEISNNYDVIDIVNRICMDNSEIRILTIPIKLSRLFSSVTIEKSNGRIKYYYGWMLENDKLTKGFQGYISEAKSVNRLYFSVPLINLKKKYDLDYLICDNNYITQELSSQIQDLKKIYNNEKYSLYKF